MSNLKERKYTLQRLEETEMVVGADGKFCTTVTMTNEAAYGSWMIAQQRQKPVTVKHQPRGVQEVSGRKGKSVRKGSSGVFPASSAGGASSIGGSASEGDEHGKGRSASSGSRFSVLADLEGVNNAGEGERVGSRKSHGDMVGKRRFKGKKIGESDDVVTDLNMEVNGDKKEVNKVVIAGGLGPSSSSSKPSLPISAGEVSCVGPVLPDRPNSSFSQHGVVRPSVLLQPAGPSASSVRPTFLLTRAAAGVPVRPSSLHALNGPVPPVQPTLHSPLFDSVRPNLLSTISARPNNCDQSTILSSAGFFGADGAHMLQNIPPDLPAIREGGPSGSSPRCDTEMSHDLGQENNLSGACPLGS